MLEYWYMLPIGIVISTIAMMTGMGGAILFTPFFLIVLKLDPLLALACGLLIELFGFSSGVIGYLKEKSINFHIVRKLIYLALPATIFGVFIARFIPTWTLKLLLALLLLLLSYQFLFGKKSCGPKHPHYTGFKKKHHEPEIDFSVKSSTLFGSTLLGMISSGLGEINEYNFLKKLNMSPPSAAGTSVFLVALCALVGVITHFFFLLREGLQVFSQVESLVLFTIPGVIIGAQVGVKLAHLMSELAMSKFISVLFFILGVMSLVSI